MATGVPVVATNVGDVPEVVINEKTGILVDLGDHEAIAGGITIIMDNSSPATRLTENARGLVVREQSAKHMLDQIERLYRNMLMKGNG